MNFPSYSEDPPTFLRPQLDYSVTWQKLKDVFKVAGRIVNVEIQTDGEGRSRGCAVVQFEEPTELTSQLLCCYPQNHVVNTFKCPEVGLR